MKNKLSVPLLLGWTFTLLPVIQQNRFMVIERSWINQLGAAADPRFSLLQPFGLSIWMQNRAIQEWGLTPATVHGLSLGAHAAAALSLLFFLQSLSRRLVGKPHTGAALFAALLFALLPIQVGTIALATGFPVIAAAFFLLMSLGWVIDPRSSNRLGRMLLSLTSFSAAILCHPAAAAGVAILLLPLPSASGEKKFFRRITIGAMFGIGAYALSHIVSTLPPHPADSSVTFALLPQAFSVLRLLLLSVSPSGLALEHTFNSDSVTWQSQLAAWAGLAAALGALSLHYVQRYRRGPTIGFAFWGLMFFSIMIVAQNLLAPGSSLIAESRSYLALPGLAAAVMAIAVPLAQWSSRNALRPMTMTFIAALPLIPYYGISLERAELYGSERKLWEEVAEQEPSNITALTILAALTRAENDFDKAKVYYERILAQDPHNITTLNSLASLYSISAFRDVDPRKTESYLKKALEFEPHNASTLENLARYYHATNQYKEAVEYYKKALAENPSAAEVQFQLGVAYANMDDIPAAIEALKVVLTMNPQNAQARRVLTIVEETQTSRQAQRKKGKATK